VLFGLLLAVLPGVGILSLIWLIGAYAVAFGVLLLVSTFRLRGRKFRKTGATTCNLILRQDCDRTSRLANP
jgi:Short repeat of unknown function (DUF308)